MYRSTCRQKKLKKGQWPSPISSDCSRNEPEPSSSSHFLARTQGLRELRGSFPQFPPSLILGPVLLAAPHRTLLLPAPSSRYSFPTLLPRTFHPRTVLPTLFPPLLSKPVRPSRLQFQRSCRNWNWHSSRPRCAASCSVSAKPGSRRHSCFWRRDSFSRSHCLRWAPLCASDAEVPGPGKGVSTSLPVKLRVGEGQE